MADFWASMSSASTPNAGRSWWGGGNVAEMADRGLKPADLKLVPPSVEDMLLTPPRVPLAALPGDIAAFCTDDKFERLLHSRGRDMVDQLKSIHGKLPNPIDIVAFPKSEADVVALMAHCLASNIAVIPFGGGSSVVQGIEAPIDASEFAACLSVDMRFFDKVLEVDEESLCIRVQVG